MAQRAREDMEVEPDNSAIAAWIAPDGVVIQDKNVAMRLFDNISFASGMPYISRAEVNKWHRFRQ